MTRTNVLAESEYWVVGYRCIVKPEFKDSVVARPIMMPEDQYRFKTYEGAARAAEEIGRGIAGRAARKGPEVLAVEPFVQRRLKSITLEEDKVQALPAIPRQSPNRT